MLCSRSVSHAWQITNASSSGSGMCAVGPWYSQSRITVSGSNVPCASPQLGHCESPHMQGPKSLEWEVTGMPRFIVRVEVLIWFLVRGAIVNTSRAIARFVMLELSPAPMQNASRSHRLGTFGAIVERCVAVRAEAHRTRPVALQSSHGEAPIIPMPPQVGHGSVSIHPSPPTSPVTAA
jgi:hypothetical protein